MPNIQQLFDLNGKTALITGAGGFLGPKHAEAVLECGGKVVLTDWHEDRVQNRINELKEKFPNIDDSYFTYYHMDVTDKASIQRVIDDVYNNGNQIDILINNAAKDPKVTKSGERIAPEARFEVMTEDFWQQGIDAAINGTFLVTQCVANKMIKHNNNPKGVIVNIASDLAVIAPDQRIYKKDGLSNEMQNVKPITYSAAKWAVIGMTKYLATYFAEETIRVNALSPTGVYNTNIPDAFVEKLTNIIPMHRMATYDEYKGAIAFLCSDASSYMTGHNLIIDGGKTVW